jgi:hypothetical protein
MFTVAYKTRGCKHDITAKCSDLTGAIVGGLNVHSVHGRFGPTVDCDDDLVFRLRDDNNGAGDHRRPDS